MYWLGSAWSVAYRTGEVLHREVEAWQECRNRDAVRVNWRFTTEDARIRLKSLYPSIQPC